MGKHHLMIGTWVKPGVIITVAFDDEKLTLELVKKTDIPQDEPISWMAFDVCAVAPSYAIECQLDALVADLNSTKKKTFTAQA